MATPMNTNMKHAGLARSLQAVMLGRDHSSRAWQPLQAVMQEEIRARRFQHDLDDVQQEVAIKLLTARKRFVGETDAAAYAYIRRVTRHVVIDRIRRDKVRPRPQTWRIGDRDPLDQLASLPTDHADPTADLEAAAEQLLDRLLSEVDVLIEQSGKQPTARELSRLQAHARVLSRIHGKPTQEIAAAIGRPDASKASVEKWVERGLPLLMTALDRLPVDDTGNGRLVMDNLRGALSKRRTDAGKSRQSRRKTQEPSR